MLRTNVDLRVRPWWKTFLLHCPKWSVSIEFMRFSTTSQFPSAAPRGAARCARQVSHGSRSFRPHSDFAGEPIQQNLQYHLGAKPGCAAALHGIHSKTSRFAFPALPRAIAERFWVSQCHAGWRISQRNAPRQNDASSHETVPGSWAWRIRLLDGWNNRKSYMWKWTQNYSLSSFFPHEFLCLRKKSIFIHALVSPS
jgi:hypothetical protein